MLRSCLRPTAAAPLLGPALRAIRSTPLARLLIGYRAIFPNSVCRPDACRCENAVPQKADHPQKPLPEEAEGAFRDCGGPRSLGEALLLERLLIGGNQNEGMPLANWAILAELRKSQCGRNVDLSV